MKNLKQLVLPCYKLEMAMSVEAWYFLHGSTDGICNLTYLLSLLSKMTVSEVQSTKRGLGYAVHPGQVDSSMLVLGHLAQGGVPPVGGFLGTRANPC